MPNALITGAAQGIGFATACHLAKMGYHVYALVRPSSDMKAIDEQPNLTKLIADVTDAEAINSAVETIMQKDGRIDVVINNACHVVVGTCETCTIAEQQESMNVNYFGAVRVLQAVLPHMRQRRSGKIIQVSSIAGYEPFPHLEPYVASKFALEGLTESLASHLAPWNIHVSLIEPVGVKTEAPRQAPLGTRILKDTEAYAQYIQHAKEHMINSYDQSLETSEVVAVIDEILKSLKPDLRYPVGKFAKARAQERFVDPTGNSYVAFKNQLLTNAFLYDILGKSI